MFHQTSRYEYFFHFGGWARSYKNIVCYRVCHGFWGGSIGARLLSSSCLFMSVLWILMYGFYELFGFLKVNVEVFKCLY